MKICIYGGSFNPPHLGHTAALRAVRAAIEPDVTLVIPDRIPPHKELTPGSPEPSERLLMTMLAFSSEPGVEVSDMELHRSGKSYTVDTVRELRDCNPDAELYLVVGTDMLTTFEQWHDYRALLAQVTLVALARTSDEHAEVERFSAYLRQTYGARVIALPAEPIPVTSTDVRRLLPQRRGSEYLASSGSMTPSPTSTGCANRHIPCSSRGASPMSGAASMRRAALPSAGAATRMLLPKPEFYTIARKNSSYLTNCYCLINMVS